MSEEWLYLQPRGKNRGRKMDGEKGGGMGYRGTEEDEEGDGVRVEGEERTERGEGQVVMNVLLFTALCLQYGCGCVRVWEMRLWVICEKD